MTEKVWEDAVQGLGKLLPYTAVSPVVPSNPTKNTYLSNQNRPFALVDHVINFL